jgi:hypothetical protein
VGTDLFSERRDAWEHGRGGRERGGKRQEIRARALQQDDKGLDNGGFVASHLNAGEAHAAHGKTMRAPTQCGGERVLLFTILEFTAEKVFKI